MFIFLFYFELYYIIEMILFLFFVFNFSKNYFYLLKKIL